MAIWVIKDGQREGPYEDQDVRELIYEGTYKDTDPAIRGGQVDWTTLGQVLSRKSSGPLFPLPPVAEEEPPPPWQEPPVPGAEIPASAPAVETTAEPPTLSDLPPPMPEAPAIPANVPPMPVESAAPPPANRRSEPVRVNVIDFDMPFGSMVTLMVKWAIAAVPALLILGVIFAMIAGVLFALFLTAVRH